MNYIFGKWRFSPGVLSSLLTVVFISLFVFLGIWQLNRAEYKRNLHAEFEEQLAAPEINFNNAGYGEQTESLLWRRAKITGHFIESKQVLLDNQVMNGEPGYFVYTPLQVDGLDKWLLVNRGWVSAGNDRMLPPSLQQTDSIVTVNGVIKQVPKTGLLLKEVSPEKITEEMLLVQRIDLSELESVLSKNLYPFILRLDAESDHGYAREWQIPGSGEAVHMGYAFQWFAFAITLLIIYLVLNIKKVY